MRVARTHRARARGRPVGAGTGGTRTGRVAAPAPRGAARAVVTPRGPHGGTLRIGGRRYPCTIGRGGAARTKREGDGATPAGVLRITGLLFRADRMGRPAPWARPIGPADLWCDDPGHPAYNRPARAPLAASAERLRRPDPLYDLVLLTDWNERGAPGRGSAIFVHRWRRAGAATEGCVALPPSVLRSLARRLGPDATLTIRAP